MIRPGKAIWRTKEYDLDVEVIKYLGGKDGERFWLVRGQCGETGVSENELIQKKSSKDWIDLLNDPFNRQLIKLN